MMMFDACASIYVNVLNIIRKQRWRQLILAETTKTMQYKLLNNSCSLKGQFSGNKINQTESNR